MINYIFNEDALTISLFSPTGEYTMINTDNPNFYKIVNLVKRPETEWSEIENIVTNKIFNYSLGYISMSEKNGDIYYQITGCEPKIIKGALYDLVVSHSKESCYKLYFNRVLEFIVSHENLMPMLDSNRCFGLSTNGLPIYVNGNGKFFESDKFLDEDDLNGCRPVESGGHFGNIQNLNSDIYETKIRIFLESFWKTKEFEKFKKLTLNQLLQDKFKVELQKMFTIFDFDILEYSIDYMTDCHGLYEFLMANVELN